MTGWHYLVRGGRGIRNLACRPTKLILPKSFRKEVSLGGISIECHCLGSVLLRLVHKVFEGFSRGYVVNFRKSGTGSSMRSYITMAARSDRADRKLFSFNQIPRPVLLLVSRANQIVLEVSKERSCCRERYLSPGSGEKSGEDESQGRVRSVKTISDGGCAARFSEVEQCFRGEKSKVESGQMQTDLGQMQTDLGQLLAESRIDRSVNQACRRNTHAREEHAKIFQPECSLTVMRNCNRYLAPGIEVNDFIPGFPRTPAEAERLERPTCITILEALEMELNPNDRLPSLRTKVVRAIGLPTTNVT